MDKKKSNRAKVPRIILVLIVVLLITGLGFASYTLLTQDSPPNSSANNESTPQQSEIKDTNNPEDFQLYESSDEKFTFNYPKNWSNVEGNLNEITTAYAAPQNDDFPNIFVWSASKRISKCSKTTEQITDVNVNGLAGKQFTEKIMSANQREVKNKITCVEKDNLVYHIVHAYAEQEYPQVYAEVLNSFKFK